MRNSTATILTIIFLLGISAALPALAYKPVVRPELSNLCVNAIAQDSYGYIWIGTANGLCKSFGNEYQIYFGHPTDSLTVPSNSIRNLYLDKDGWLFVATTAGICAREKGSRVFHRFVNDGDKKEFNAYGFIDYADKLYCYGEKGLYEISKDKRAVTRRLYLGDEPFICAHTGPDGLLWLTNGSNVVAVDKDIKVIKQKSFAAEDRVNTLSATDRYILLGTPHGILNYDVANGTIRQSAIGRDVEIRHIKSIDDSTHLVATGNKGVLAYSHHTGKVSHKYHDINFKDLQSAEINKVFVDRDKNIWVSTFDRGEAVMPNTPSLFNADRELVKALRNDFVTRVMPDTNRNLWFGTRSHGLGVLDTRTNKVRYFNSSSSGALKSFSHDFVQEMIFDPLGRLWIGYNNNLIVCRPVYTADGKVSELKIEKKFSDFLSMVSMAVDKHGNVWAGSDDKGLYIIDKELNVIDNITMPQLGSNNITKIIPYDDNNVLVSAYNDNLYLINTTTRTIQPLGIKNEAAAASAIDMLIDRDRNLWIGTYHNGLYRVDKATNNTIQCRDDQAYFDAIGLAQDNNGDIWASSSYGIYRFDNDGTLINTYFKSNGLGGNQFHEKCVGIKPDGKLLFGGNAGIEEIVPQSNASAPAQPIKLVTKGLWLLPDYSPALKDDMADSDEASVSEITLDHKDNSINIEFFALNYDKTNDIEYAYMLKGSDKDFIYTGNYNRVSYSDISAGDYAFFVKARYTDGEWQEPVQLLQLSVKPNPWLSTPAIVFYTLLALALIIFINRIYLRVKLIKQKYALSEERIKQEKLITANRIHFFTNISHELRTPLTLISGPEKHLRQNYKTMTDKQVKESFDFIDSNIERLLTLINQLLSFRSVNSETLPLQVSRADIGAQLDSLVKLYNTYASENSVKISLKKPTDEPIYLTYDSDKVEKVISNLIVNAVKYSTDEGFVSLKLELVKNPDGFDFDADTTFARITVTDNGCGMAEEDIPKIFQPFKRLLGINDKKAEGFGIGLHFVAQLVKEHKGKIDTHKNDHGGMTFIVTFPASEHAFTTSEFRLQNNDVALSNSTSGTFDINDYSQPVDTEPVEIDEDCRPKILVVDDNHALNTFISSLFEQNYTVVQAYDGQEGLELARQECPELIISDIRMPGTTDGYALCSEIKGNPATSHIPLILLSAKTLDENKVRGYNCGADAYLTKPFSPEVLIACVNNLNAKREQQASLILASAGLSDQPVAEPQMTQDMSPLDKKFLEKLYAYIENNLDNCDLNVNMLGRELGFSRTNFYRKVKALTGISPTDLLRVYRLNRAAELLLTREYTVGEVGEKIGFGSQSHFSSLFKKHFGVSPRAYVANHFSQYCPAEEA